MMVEKLQKNMKYLNKNMAMVFIGLKHLEGRSPLDMKELFDDIYKKISLANKNIRNIELEIKKKNIR